MIKFFRRIRYDLMEKNLPAREGTTKQAGKSRQYLKYALGEIILVVIGILIALSINNWNEERLLKKAEINFYNNTKQQLLDDAQNIHSQIRYNSTYYNEFVYAINIIEKNDLDKKDSLGQIAINLLRNSDFDRQGNIYQTMVNSGDIKLLKNNKIVQNLRRLEETYIYMNRMETIHFNALMSMVPDLTQTIRFSSSTVENEEKLYGFEFQNLFSLSLKIMGEKEEIYNRGLNEIDAIIELIDSEL